MVARSIGGSVMHSGFINSWINKRSTTSPCSSLPHLGDNTNDQERAVKRQKISTPQQQPVAVGQVAFPFYCAKPTFIETLTKEPLRDCWAYMDGSAAEQKATLKILTVGDHQLILENKVCLDSTSMATTTTAGECSTGEDQQLFVNLARLYNLNVLTTLDMTLECCNTAGQSNNCVLTLTLGADIGHRYTRKHLFLLLFPYLYPTRGGRSFGGPIPIDEFYRHLQPPVSNTLLTKCQAPGLHPTLMPFQSQNVEWMVNREGLSILEDGSLQEKAPLPDQVPFFWERLAATTSGQLLYISRVSGRIFSSWTEELEAKRDRVYRGGVLADEMGLGKTVSIIALILLNTSTKSTLFDHINDDGLRKTGATLIITPETIIHQWASEFKRHVPGLQVAQYSGIKTIPDGVETRDYAETLASNDIVLTTYEVLKAEVHYARNLSDRPRRHDIKHVARRSPLVQILWWRCVVDEAQQVEASLSNAAEMACLIPRYYSWGVTGTPLKASNYSDLYGLFVFLDQFDDINKTRFREMSISPGLQPAFMRYTQQIMRRNTKHYLQNQIYIPKQHRHVIKISFSTIEQHYYNDLHDMCKQEADPRWLDSIGWVKPSNTSSPDYIKYIDSTRALRKWLTTLRETCVYPALGKDSDEDIHSLGQVLDIMIQKIKDTIEEAQVSLANNKLRYGGMHELQQEGWDIPLMVYMEWLPHVEEQVKIHGTRVTEARHANLLNRQQSSNLGDGDSNGKGQDSKILKALLAAHTTWQNILHRFYFYIAGVYHMLENKEKEDEYYDKAADTRRQILARPQEKVRASVQEVEKVDHRLLPGKMTVSFSPQKETLLLTDDFLTRVDDLTETMNQQMEVIAEWRVLLKRFLASNLVDSSGGDDVKGDEYDNSLIIQEKCDIYQDIYQDILRDRHYWVNGVWQAPRVTNIQEDNGAPFSDTQNEEIKHLREELDQLRQKLAPSNGGSLRELVAKLREMASGQNTTHKVEQHLVQAELTRLAREFKQQKDLQDALEAEYRKLSTLANHRIEYYRALQQISDHVGIWECQNPHAEIDELDFKMTMLQDRIAEQCSRQRYLENIAKEKQNQNEGDANDQDLFCLICNEHFTTGIVTHCTVMYVLTRGSEQVIDALNVAPHSLPSPDTNFTDPGLSSKAWSVATVQQDEQVQSVAENNSSAGLTTSALREIEKVSIQKGLGAKLDNVIRHIKYIQQTNNGKCLVFSQWNRLLGLISRGLTKNGLGHVNLTAKKKDNSIERFRFDPSINVMLLHARSHSSGLTLLEAKTVFIIEPVLNESLEKQAIGRVHRIGQTEETSVFWYIVRDTIEERIQAIHSAKQRHRHNNNDMEGMGSTAIPPLTSLSEGGGEYVTDEDLQKCFTQE